MIIFTLFSGWALGRVEGVATENKELETKTAAVIILLQPYRVIMFLIINGIIRITIQVKSWIDRFIEISDFILFKKKKKTGNII